MGQIIEFQEYKKAKDRIQELKNTLYELIFERDHLKFVVCENLKAEYLLEFGSLEYRIYKAYCEYLRLRRKRELIQAKKNRQEKIEMDEIEKQLDEEFVEYKKKLNEKIHEMNDALKRAELKFLSDEDSKTLKKLYKEIVKMIHPDINPSITDEQQELFYKATEAYEHGDLTTIQIINDIVTSGSIDDLDSIPTNKLKDEVKRLEALVEEIQTNIELVKSTPPYTWKLFLEDDDKRTNKKNELEDILGSYEEAVKTQEEYINDLLGRKYE